MKLKQRTWEILDIAKPGDRASKAFDIFILTLISLNVLAVVVSSMRTVEERYQLEFYYFEVFSIAVFTFEYVARVWSCVSTKEYSNPITGRLRFMIRPMSVIDLLAVLPFYLVFVTADLRFVRSLRLFRIFRVAKVGRYSSSMRLFGKVFTNKKEELTIAVLALVVLVVIASSLMYLAEGESQPDKYTDIPTTMWWSVVTLTTVGYGDVFPVTPLGKLLAMMIAVLGVGICALPAGILGAGFVEEIQKQKAKKVSCPHCGREIQ
jgi:voltage-gated potassium channel